MFALSFFEELCSNGNVDCVKPVLIINNVCGRRLTERVSSNHGLGLQVNSRSILVDSSDSEEVLCIFEQSSDVTEQLLALGVHNDPVQPVGVASLYDVMRHLITTILNGSLPAQCAGFFRDFANYNAAFTHSRGIWKYQIQALSIPSPI